LVAFPLLHTPISPDETVFVAFGINEILAAGGVDEDVNTVADLLDPRRAIAGLPFSPRCDVPAVPPFPI
jgi:hypothetical protein